MIFRHLFTLRTAACVSLLLSQGCDLSLTDGDGYTAAAHALAFDQISVVEILPISAFFTENLNPKIKIPISNITENNQKKEISDTDIDIQVEVPWVISRSAFHILCQWGSIKSLNYLLTFNQNGMRRSDAVDVEVTESMEIGRDINTKNENHHTNFDYLFPVNFALSDGTTALHVAARYGHINCLKKLIEVGGDFRVMDIHGNTPLLLSRKWGRTECEIYLFGLQDDTH